MSDAERQAFAQHLEVCAYCAQKVRNFERLYEAALSRFANAPAYSDARSHRSVVDSAAAPANEETDGLDPIPEEGESEPAPPRWKPLAIPELCETGESESHAVVDGKMSSNTPGKASWLFRILGRRTWPAVAAVLLVLALAWKWTNENWLQDESSQGSSLLQLDESGHRIEHKRVVDKLNIAELHFRLGDHRDALENAKKALVEAERLRADREIAQASELIGAIAGRSGELERALISHLDSARLLEDLADHENLAIAWHKIGRIFAELGQHSSATRYLSLALDHSSWSGRPLEKAASLVDLADSRLRLGEQTEAKKLYLRAEAIFESRRSISGVVEVALRMGGLFRESKEYQKAIEEYSRANRTAEQGSLLKARLLAELCQTYHLAGYEWQSIQLCEAAVEAFAEASQEGMKVEENLALAQALRRLGRYGESRVALERALRKVDAVGAAIVNPEFQRSFFEGQPVYEMHIDLLVDMHREDPQAGHDWTAFELFEKTRARVLRRQIFEGAQDMLGTFAEEPYKAALYQRRAALLVGEQLGLADWSLPRQGLRTFEEVRLDLEHLLEQLGVLESRRRIGESAFDDLPRRNEPSLDDILKEVLDEDTLLLAVGFGQESGFLWLFRPHDFRSHILPDKESLERMARQANRFASTRTDLVSSRREAVFRNLGRILLERDADWLEATSRVVVAAQGALAIAPFSLLSADIANAEEGATLIDTHEIVIAPSVSTVYSMRRRRFHYDAARRSVAVFADPILPKGFRSRPTPSPLFLPRLPHTEKEAESIVEWLDKVGTYVALGTDASYQTLGSLNLADYRILHFATHGLYKPAMNELSGIVLSADRNNPAGKLLMSSDVDALRSMADLVVLSASNTARGRNYRDEGIVGLVQAFQRKGASQVLATLWTVDDESTFELMKEFYANVLRRGLGPAAALREAQVSLRRGSETFSSPHYWAGFVLHGDWIERENRESDDFIESRTSDPHGS